MATKNKKKKNKRQFSKTLLIQESILIWIITLAFLALGFICVVNGYLGELPWITVIVGFPWTAYGVSQAYYYKKSTKENTKGGVVFEQAMKEDPVIEEDAVG